MTSKVCSACYPTDMICLAAKLWSWPFSSIQKCGVETPLLFIIWHVSIRTASFVYLYLTKVWIASFTLICQCTVAVWNCMLDKSIWNFWYNFSVISFGIYTILILISFIHAPVLKHLIFREGKMLRACTSACWHSISICRWPAGLTLGKMISGANKFIWDTRH